MSESEQTTSVELTAICEWLNLSKSRISQLKDLGIITTSGKNSYPLQANVTAYIRYLQKGNSGQTQVSDGDEVTGDDYHRHRARLYKARADAAELEAAQLRGDLHASSAVEDVWIDMIASARAKLLSTPTRIAASIQGVTDIGEIKNKVEESIFEALNELTTYDPSRVTLQPISQNQSEVETTTETDCEQVG